MGKMSKEGLESKRQALAEVKGQRREIWFELIKEVVPRKQDEAMPKKSLLNMAVAQYEAEKEQRKDADPFLSCHSDSFISVKTGLNYWSDIREIAAANGLYLAWNHRGVFGTTAKTVIARTFAAEQRQIERTVERHVGKAERVNHKRSMQLPLLTIQAYLPATTEGEAT